MSIKKLAGKFHEWSICGHEENRFAEVTLPFAECVEYLMAVPYDALTGKGEQRELVISHVRKLKKEILAGNYTPTPVSAGLRPNHKEAVVWAKSKFELEVDSQDPLPLTDGGHRFQSLLELFDELGERIQKATDGESNEDADQLIEWRKQFEKLPITITIYFDSDPQQDFLNLQLGRTIDRAHLLSLKIQQSGTEDPIYQRAFEIARILDKDKESPFYGTIRFDSRGSKPLPLSTLLAKGGSDLSTSIVGLARLGEMDSMFTAQKLAECVVDAFRILSEKCPEILCYGKALTPIAQEGTKGSSTMLTGMGICLAYRLYTQGNQSPSEEDEMALVEAAEESLAHDVRGNFSGPVKRVLMGQFCEALFGEVPVELMEELSFSSFGQQKPKKEKKPKTEQKVESELDDDIPEVMAPWEEEQYSESELEEVMG